MFKPQYVIFFSDHDSKSSADDIPYDPEDDSQLPYKKAKSDREDKKSQDKPSVTTVTELIGRISKCNSPAESTALTVAALATLKSTQEKRRFLLDLTSKVEEQKKLLEKKEVAKLTARTLVSAIYAISAASKALIPVAKVAAKTGSLPSASLTAASTTESPTTSTPLKSDTVVQSSSEKKVVVSPSLISTAPSDSVTEIKTSTISSDITVTSIAQADFSMVEMNSGQDVDMRIGTRPPVSSRISGETITSVEKNVQPPNFYVENPSISMQDTPLEESSKPVNPSEMPEALKSLFSIMPSANYNFMSNIKDSSEKDTKETEVVDSYSTSSGQLSSTQSEEVVEEEAEAPKGKKNTFNVSLLDFDYGDSDSDGEDSSKVPHRSKPGKRSPSGSGEGTEGKGNSESSGKCKQTYISFINKYFIALG